jgi:hypothetical protein
MSWYSASGTFATCFDRTKDITMTLVRTYEQGCTSVACCSGRWLHRGQSAPRRFAPSIRSDLISGRDKCVARAGNRDDLASGRLKIVMQLGLQKHKELPDVPMLDEFVTKPQDRLVLDMIFSRQAMGRPLVAPPGLDPRLGTALREAFAKAMRDPQLIAEGAKMDLDLGFVSGVDVQALVERLYKSPPEVIARAQAIVATN